MTAPLHLTDEERDELERATANHYTAHVRALKKLSDARAALWEVRPLFDRPSWAGKTATRDRIDRALAGTRAPVAVPAPRSLMVELKAASAEVDAWPQRDKDLRELALQAERHFVDPVAVPAVDLEHAEIERLRRQLIDGAMAAQPGGFVCTRVQSHMPDCETSYGEARCPNCIVNESAAALVGLTHMPVAVPGPVQAARQAAPPIVNVTMPQPEAVALFVQAAYAECARIARRFIRDEQATVADRIADGIEAAAVRVTEAPSTDAPDLDLLAKFARGEGGRRTGALMRAGLIHVEVTEAGRAEMAKGGGKVRACPNCLGTGRWWNTVYQSYYDCPCNEMRAMVALTEMMKLFLSVRL